MKRAMMLVVFLLAVAAWPQTHPAPLRLNQVLDLNAPRSFTMSAKNPGPSIGIGGSQIFFVKDEDGNLMVNIDQQGKVTYGEKYKPDDAAKTFWNVLAKYYPIVCASDPVAASKKSAP